jgi:cytochrome c5
MRLPALAFFTVLFSCSVAAETDETVFVRFDGTALESGRALWLDNCKGCHGYGVAGAPIPMQADQWQVRVIKSRQVLYAHAINGFFGPDDTMMPERGGNPELTDEQVRLAVDYMIVLAKYYIKQLANQHK